MVQLRARTKSLNVAYEQTGPADGQAVLLLHGFPYDVRQYDAVRDGLQSLHVRVIVPYLRGFGPTTYASASTFRSGQQAALGRDVIDLLDVLDIERAVLAGYDWGGRAACITAALWPERVQGLVSSGYTIQDIASAATTPQDPELEHQLWYQWYFHTERGRAGLEKNRSELCKLLWKMWSPTWNFSEEAFATTAKSFDNPDFVATVIHSYRHRYGNAAGDPTLQGLEDRLASKPQITAPAITVNGEDDHVEPASARKKEASRFSSHYERRVLPRVGHCISAEAPTELTQAIRDILAIVA